MSKYGDVAILATARAQSGQDPGTAWDEAALLLFPTQVASRKKGCPRSAFLGLIAEGLVKNVQRAGKPGKNGEYAVRATEALRRHPELAESPVALWARTPGASKQHNGQMDVVTALWKCGFLRGVAG